MLNKSTIFMKGIKMLNKIFKKMFLFVALVLLVLICMQQIGQWLQATQKVTSILKILLNL